VTTTADLLANPSAVLQQLLTAGALPPQAFGAQSRYNGLPILTRTSSDGAQQSYVSRRFIPQPDAYGLLQRYRVQQGDRIDVIAATLLGDPLLYWQICDANLASDPNDTVATPGAFIDITLPAGVPGAGVPQS
jgi:hypothetical protein